APAGCGGGGGGGGGATSNDGSEAGGGDAGSSTAPLESAIKSTNFSGYQRAGAPLGFKKVSGTWIVPSVTPSSSDTASSIWAGIGGGCTNPPDCTLVEPTLIQAGTEQDS